MSITFSKPFIRPSSPLNFSSLGQSTCNQNFPAFYPPNTRKVGFVLKQNLSGLSANKLGHNIASNHGITATDRQHEPNPWGPDAEKAKMLNLNNHKRHRDNGDEGEEDGEEGKSLRSKKTKTRDSSDDIIHSPKLITDNATEDYYTGSHVDSFEVLRKLLEYPQVQQALHSVKATLLPILLQNLSMVESDKVTLRSGLETAASVDLLKLFVAPSPELDAMGSRVLEGARLLEEGQKKVIHGKEMLEFAFKEIPKLIKLNMNQF